MSTIATQLRNAARHGSPVAPGEREKAADTIDKLVEALRELTERIADPEQWNPAMKPDQFRLALGTVQGAQQFTAATALLRDLGEAS